ncbi:MAG TPA: malonyl-CoA synthase [Pseudolabrys sp.]|jgi:malonyl-CoA/methylmalonyl-CoA synthetase
MSDNLFKIVRERVPSTTFIETPDGREITSADAIERSGHIANALVKRGVVPGDRVAAQVEKSADAIMLYLACLRAGAVYLPLNIGYTLAELEYYIGDAEPRVVVCAPERHVALAPVATKLGVAAVETLGTHQDGTILDLAKSQSSDFKDVPRAADDLAAILYTSGTTGRSKGAMLTHRNLASNAQALLETWRFTSKDVLLHALPIFHTHGLFVATNLVLLSGASMIFMPKFDADEIFRFMPRATTMMGVPTFYVRLLQDKRLNPETTKHMRMFIAGSAPLLAETHREWKAATGHAILERYGMTETNMLTSNPYDGERVPGSVGFPLPGVELRIADSETGKLLPDGDVGMIEVKGPNVFKGYWRMPDKTKAEFRGDGFFITGDLGKIGPNRYVYIVGRAKDLVISGGHNVYPKEVETELDAVPGVIESAVIGVPHKDFGEGVTAVIVKQVGAALDERGVQKALDGRLAKFKLPKAVMFVDALPRNTMGKVLKNELRERYKDIYSLNKTG